MQGDSPCSVFRLCLQGFLVAEAQHRACRDALARRNTRLQHRVSSLQRTMAPTEPHGPCWKLICNQTVQSMGKASPGEPTIDISRRMENHI